MKLVELAILYGVVGFGCVAAFAVRRGVRRVAAWDAALLLVFWPLYGPVALARALPPALQAGGGDLSFEATLAAARATPLASLLPDDAAIASLARRLSDVARRVTEIDRLLADPAFAEPLARERQAALERAGDARSAEIVASRRQNVARLASLRDRYRRELDEIRELLLQLRLQAEIVRLAGRPEEQSSALVDRIVARVEGLDVFLSEESDRANVVDTHDPRR